MTEDEPAIERIREGFAPPELSASEAAHFDAVLDTRRHGGLPFWIGPALVAAAALVFVAWPAPVPEGAPAPMAAAVPADTLEDALTDSSDYWAVDDEGEDPDDDLFPHEFLALAEVLAPLDEDDPLEVLR